MAMLVLAACGPSEKEKIAAREAAEQAQAIATLREGVARKLLDPGSAQFRDERLTPFNSALCGQVNGKNTLGAYVGFKRFYGAGTLSVIDDSGLPFEQNLFDSMWNTHCQALTAR